MKQLTFWNGVVVALLGSVIGSIGFFGLAFLFSDDSAIRLIISGLAFAYIAYVLSRSQERIGRITILSIWLILLVMLWLFYPPLTLFVVLNVLAIWLIRSLYAYASLLPALADLGLSAFGIATAFWTFHHTGSLFLTFWCFLLAQALFVYLPTGVKQPNTVNVALPNRESDFKRAYQTAEAAVRKLSSLN